MSYVGIVRHGVVVLPPDAALPEGTEVEVAVRETSSAEDPFLTAILATAKSRPHWPADYVQNHSHYTDGEPLK